MYEARDAGEGAARRSESWEYRDRILSGVKRRIGATLGLITGGGLAIVLYLAFLAEKFAWFQSLAIILTILVLVPVVIVAMWVSFGLSIGRMRRREGWGRGFGHGPMGKPGGFWASISDSGGARDPESATVEIESYVSYLEDIAPTERDRVAALSPRFRGIVERLERLAPSTTGPARNP
jgi:hypothetical protein